MDLLFSAPVANPFGLQLFHLKKRKGRQAKIVGFMEPNLRKCSVRDHRNTRKNTFLLVEASRRFFYTIKKREGLVYVGN